MSTSIEPSADHKEEFTAWNQSSKDTLIVLGFAVFVMAVGSGILVLWNWSEVMAVAPFGLGCTLLTGAGIGTGVFVLKFGERRGARAQLIATERIAELMREVAELRDEMAEQRKVIETLTGQLARIAQASTELEQQRLRRGHQ